MHTPSMHRGPHKIPTKATSLKLKKDVVLKLSNKIQI